MRIGPAAHAAGLSFEAAEALIHKTAVTAHAGVRHAVEQLLLFSCILFIAGCCQLFGLLVEFLVQFQECLGHSRLERLAILIG